MKIARLLPSLLMLAVLCAPTPLLAQLRFQEGKHYTTVPTPMAAGLAPAGKVEVTEVFSYICSHCYEWQGLVEGLKTALPEDAALTYVHAGFNQYWPLFQRAHLTAQKLGVADRNHKRMFTAVWETQEFPFLDKTTGRPLATPPTMADFARFYAKGGGVTEAEFLKTATSPAINAAVERAESLVKGWRVSGTPSFLVGGRYMVAPESVSSEKELHDLFSFLVSLERSRLKKAAAPAK
ncbi:MAG TPA: thiol:disulfide interchange protein DsbA/DsbL [Steroidobacteraceae bacterium]|nr:thiol:disulfide interchange protein DsbA/DsbL [Steroidobacteraceae bacterium]